MVERLSFLRRMVLESFLSRGVFDRAVVVCTLVFWGWGLRDLLDGYVLRDVCVAFDFDRKFRTLA